MRVCRKSLAVSLLATATLLAGVAWSEVGQLSQAKAAPPPQKPPPAEIEALKKAQEAQKKAAHEARKAQEAEVLKSAYTLLAAANDNYEGHKGKAMHEIEAALKLLDENGLKQAQQKVRALQDLHKVVAAKLLPEQSAGGHELQAISDAQVAHGARLLTQLAVVLAANKQPKLLEHVETAIKELQAAPKHDAAETVVKGKELEVLTIAYVLLAGANHDYDGHSVKAMKAIEEACAILDLDLQNAGTVEEKVKALKDAQAETLAKIKNKENPTITEPQALSDAQMILADVFIRRVAGSWNEKKHEHLLKHLSQANTEIGIALSVR